MYQKGQQPIRLPIMLMCHQGSQVTNWYLPAAKDSSPIMQTLSIWKQYANLINRSHQYADPSGITSMSVNPDK